MLQGQVEKRLLERMKLLADTCLDRSIEGVALDEPQFLARSHSIQEIERVSEPEVEDFFVQPTHLLLRDALEEVREHLDVVPTLPSRWTPEELPEPVASEDEYVAFPDSGPLKA